MKVRDKVIDVSFHELINLFKKKEDGLLQLHHEIGEGYVQIFNLEPGLQARIWDCVTTCQLELYSDADATSSKTSLTIVYFESTVGLKLVNAYALNAHHLKWDQLFFSGLSDHILTIAPMTAIRCITICFSKKWISRQMEENKSWRAISDKIYSGNRISVVGSIPLTEKELIFQMLKDPAIKTMGLLSVKSAVYKMIADYLNKLSEEDAYAGYVSSKDIFLEVEQFLFNHIEGPLPDLKSLSSDLGISVSTLKRQFKKQYHLSISAYFIQKKMEYARELINQQFTLSKVAELVGYRSVHKFSVMYRKCMERET